MGNLADIFVTDENQAANYDPSHPLPVTLSGRWKSLTPVELAVLWAIIRRAEDFAPFQPEFTLIRQDEQKHESIHALPAAFLQDLLALTPHDVAQASGSWAAAQELSWSCKPRYASNIIHDVIRLARKAIDAGAGVYLCNHR